MGMIRERSQVWEATPRPWVIYALEDPRTKAIRYVGSTSDARKRLHQHTRCHYPLALSTWLQELTTAGLTPTMLVLSRLSGLRVEAREQERRHIEWLRRRGCVLLNVAKIREGRA